MIRPPASQTDPDIVTFIRAVRNLIVVLPDGFSRVIDLKSRRNKAPRFFPPIKGKRFRGPV